MREFFIRMLLWQLFSSYMYLVKAAEMMFVWKIYTFNVDEIDTWWFEIFPASFTKNVFFCLLSFLRSGEGERKQSYVICDGCLLCFSSLSLASFLINPALGKTFLFPCLFPAFKSKNKAVKCFCKKSQAIHLQILSGDNLIESL